MEHGLKDIAFYVQKHITPCTVVITSLLVRDKPLGTPASVLHSEYENYALKLLPHLSGFNELRKTNQPFLLVIIYGIYI